MFQSVRFLYYLSFCLCKSCQRTHVTHSVTECRSRASVSLKTSWSSGLFSKASAKVVSFCDSAKCFWKFFRDFVMFLWFVGGLWVVCERSGGYRGARRARGSRRWRTGWIGAGRGMDVGESCRKNDRTRGRRETEGRKKEGRREKGGGRERKRRDPVVKTKGHEEGGEKRRGGRRRKERGSTEDGTGESCRKNDRTRGRRGTEERKKGGKRKEERGKRKEERRRGNEGILP